MSSIREEIEEILSPYVLKGTTRLEVEATYQVLSIIEKRIDELKTKYPEDLYRAYNAGLDDVKEILLK